MADELISRSALLKDISESVVFTVRPDMPSAELRGANKIIDRIKAAPAVEVVRCKDCIRCGFCGEATNLEVMGFYGYCSRGRRREENAAD